MYAYDWNDAKQGAQSNHCALRSSVKRKCIFDVNKKIKTYSIACSLLSNGSASSIFFSFQVAFLTVHEERPDKRERRRTKRCWHQAYSSMQVNDNGGQCWVWIVDRAINGHAHHNLHHYRFHFQWKKSHLIFSKPMCLYKQPIADM